MQLRSSSKRRDTWRMENVGDQAHFKVAAFQENIGLLSGCLAWLSSAELAGTNLSAASQHSRASAFSSPQP